MAKQQSKKTVIKKEPVSALDVLESKQALLEKRVEQLERRAPVKDFGSQIRALEQRIDRLVDAISKSKRTKGL